MFISPDFAVSQLHKYATRL